VVVHDLNVVCIATVPPEADPPLVVDPDAVLASAITAQSFKTVARGHPKIVKLGRSIQHPELSQSHLLRTRSESASGAPVEETLCVSVPEALDHSR
jgi:hypothetical protein